MNTDSKFVFAIPIIFCMIACTTGVAQFAIPRQVFGGGVVQSGDANYKMIGTVAQPIIGFADNTVTKSFHGFWYSPNNIAVSVEDEQSAQLTSFCLKQNYPNPLRASTTIEYVIPSHSYVTLEVCNLLGISLRTLVDAEQSGGSHTVTWNGSGFESGVYIYRLRAGRSVVERKFLVIK